MTIKDENRRKLVIHRHLSSFIVIWDRSGSSFIVIARQAWAATPLRVLGSCGTPSDLRRSRVHRPMPGRRARPRQPRRVRCHFIARIHMSKQRRGARNRAPSRPQFWPSHPFRTKKEHCQVRNSRCAAAERTISPHFRPRAVMRSSDCDRWPRERIRRSHVALQCGG